MSVQVTMPTLNKLGYDPKSTPRNQPVDFYNAYGITWDNATQNQGAFGDGGWQWRGLENSLFNMDLVREVDENGGTVENWTSAIVLGDTVLDSDILPDSIPDSVAIDPDTENRRTWSQWPGVVVGVRTVEDPNGDVRVGGGTVRYVLSQPASAFPSDVLVAIDGDMTADMEVVSQQEIADLASQEQDEPTPTGGGRGR